MVNIETITIFKFEKKMNLLVATVYSYPVTWKLEIPLKNMNIHLDQRN